MKWEDFVAEWEGVVFEGWVILKWEGFKYVTLSECPGRRQMDDVTTVCIKRCLFSSVKQVSHLKTHHPMMRLAGCVVR